MCYHNCKVNFTLHLGGVDMDKQEVLKKAQEKKPIVCEMEKTKIDKSNWIAVTVTGIIATIFMIVEGALGHYASIHAIGAICFTWAAIFYFCQYFIAKRKHFGILLGAILESLAVIIMIVLYVLRSVGVL